MTVTVPCDHCGRALTWTAAQLSYAAQRLASGDYACCACDDDCAVAGDCEPWDRSRLEALLEYLS
jgi:hypothetical protein